MHFRSALAICVVCLLLIVLSGCETVKGAAQGLSKDWQTAKKADNWLRENLW